MPLVYTIGLPANYQVILYFMHAHGISYLKIEFSKQAKGGKEFFKYVLKTFSTLQRLQEDFEFSTIAYFTFINFFFTLLILIPIGITLQRFSFLSSVVPVLFLLSEDLNEEHYVYS